MSQINQQHGTTTVRGGQEEWKTTLTHSLTHSLADATVNKSVWVQPPTSAVNATLLAFVAERNLLRDTWQHALLHSHVNG